MNNENTRLILVGFLITLGICTVIFVLDNIIPTEMKFNAQIWGTINDWCIYGLTLVTAVFLYRTLRSQTEVQEMQQRITDIEDFKFKRELMPKFEIRGKVPEYKKDKIDTKYHIVCRDNIAKKVSVICLSKCSGELVNNSWEEKVVKADSNINFHHGIPTKNGDQYFEIKINIVFEDVAGNKYLQYAEIIKPDRGTQSYGERTEPMPITDNLSID